MEKFRICVYCGCKNDDALLECDECGADLSFVDPIEVKEEESEKKGESNEYRICENCDYRNDVSFRECEACGADISFVSPSVIIEECIDNREEGSTYEINKIKLVSIKDEFEIQIPSDRPIVLGREGDLFNEYFNKSNFVSRRHARIYFENNNYVIVDESSNGTTVNKIRIKRGEEYVLSLQDRIVIADMEFIVISV